MQESNFEQRKKNVNVEGRKENKNNNNFNGNFNGEARDCKKDFGNKLKRKRGNSRKINSGKIKIMKERELEVGKNAGSVGKRGISGRNIRASRKTRNSRALWGELG